MTDLSPAAQAVMDAAYEELDVADLLGCVDFYVPQRHVRWCAAAALRAAADQVVPPALEEEFFDRNHALPLQKMVEIRLSLLAIADELEAT